MHLLRFSMCYLAPCGQDGMVLRKHESHAYKLFQWQQVHYASRGSIMFSGNDHPMAPLSRLAVWHFFQYAHGLITDEVVVKLLLPVKRYGGRSMASHRLSQWIHVDFYRRSSHTMKRAMWASVKGGGCVFILEPFWHCSPVCTKMLLTKKVAVQRSAGGRHKCEKFDRGKYNRQTLIEWKRKKA